MLTSYSSSIGNLSTHITFVPKYRHKIFAHPEVKDFCEEVFRQVAEEYGFRIDEIGFDIDHVHLLVDLTNKYSAAEAARLLKGTSARKLLQEFPWLRQKYFWGGHLWSPAYYFGSVGNATYGVVSNYVRNQAKKGDNQRKLIEFMPPASAGGS